MATSFPIGVQDFRELVRDGYVYVDKTLMIKRIIDTKAKVSLYTRPRRFGKTLNLSMIDYFFNIKYKDETDLFDGLLISEHPECFEHRSKYPVIRLDLSTISCTSFDTFKTTFAEMIADMMTDFDYLEKEDLSLREREICTRLSTGKESDGYMVKSVYNLSMILKRVHGTAPIIIFDEYDFCYHKSFQTPEYNKITGIMSEFLRLSLKSNTNLSFGIVSGIMRAAKEDIFSGLNSLDVYDIFNNRYDEFYGFTREEVALLIEKCGMPDILDDLKEWYDGYRFGSTDVYNPWSIMCCLQNGGDTSEYWVNSGSSEIIEDIIIRNRGKGIADDILSLISNPETVIESSILPSVTFRELLADNNNPELLKMNLHSLMVMSGYLKAIRDGDIYQLSIPNKEVLMSYDRMITRLFGFRRTNQSKLYSYLTSKNSESAEDELNRLFSPGSIRDEWGHNDYKHAIMILFQYMGYDNVTERESGDGFIDIYVHPTSNQPAIIMEIKVTKTARNLQNMAEAALRQIEERDYASGRDAILCGISFNKKNCCVRIR